MCLFLPNSNKIISLNNKFKKVFFYMALLYRRIHTLALTTLALFVLSPGLSTRVAGSDGKGYCEVPEFKDCENCTSIDLEASEFDGCGITIEGDNITM